MIDLLTAQRACAALLGFALVLQSAELLAMRRAYADDGVWSVQLLDPDLAAFPRILAAFLRRSFAPGWFFALLCTRLAAGILLIALAPGTWASGLATAWALLGSLLVCIRFRGVFNGGSDYMTVAVACGLTCAAFGGRATAAGLLYIAVQALASYTIAGLAKLREPRWRSGAALGDLLRLRSYGVPAWLALGPRSALSGAWAVMAFEVSAPCSLLSPGLCLGYLTLAFLFHLGTVVAFGLNRFVWAWAASYPALWWLSSMLDSARR